MPGEVWLYYYSDEEDRAYDEYPLGAVFWSLLGLLFLFISFLPFIFT